MTKKFLNLEPSSEYDGYDDYLDAVTYNYTDDQENEDYDEELEVPDYERV